MQIILRQNDTISPNQFIFYTIDMVIQREFDIRRKWNTHAIGQLLISYATHLLLWLLTRITQRNHL